MKVRDQMSRHFKKGHEREPAANAFVGFWLEKKRALPSFFPLDLYLQFYSHYFLLPEDITHKLWRSLIAKIYTLPFSPPPVRIAQA